MPEMSERLRAWAALSREEQLAIHEANRRAAAVDPAARDAVLACPHRGPEGGLVLTEEEQSCCGGGAERTACAAGKGQRPGRVTLRECLQCRSPLHARPAPP